MSAGFDHCLVRLAIRVWNCTKYVMFLDSDQLQQLHQELMDRVAYRVAVEPDFLSNMNFLKNVWWFALLVLLEVQPIQQ